MEILSYEALQLVRRLEGLAATVLKSEVFGRAHEAAQLAGAVEWLQRQKTPPVHEQPGACWVLFVRPKDDNPCIRQSFALPLIWRGDDAGLCTLPEPLRDVQREALEILLPRDRTRWHVCLGAVQQQQRAARALKDCLECRVAQQPQHPAVDNSRWPAVACASAFVPLAAALLLAESEQAAQPGVFSTGAWENGRVVAVNNLPLKLQAAHAWASSCNCSATLFVPPGGAEELRGMHECTGPAARVKVVELLAARAQDHPLPSLLHTIGGLLEALDVQPPDAAPDRQKFAYYRRKVAMGRGGADEFHDTQLLPVVAKRFRWPGYLQIRLLVGWRDEKSSAFAQVRQTLPEASVLEFFQPRNERAATPPGVVHVPAEMRREDVVDLIRKRIADAGVPDEAVACDLTGGTKLMTLATLAAAPRGSTLLYIQARREIGGPQGGHRNKADPEYTELLHWVKE